MKMGGWRFGLRGCYQDPVVSLSAEKDLTQEVVSGWMDVCVCVLSTHTLGTGVCLAACALGDVKRAWLRAVGKSAFSCGPVALHVLVLELQGSRPGVVSCLWL